MTGGVRHITMALAVEIPRLQAHSKTHFQRKPAMTGGQNVVAYMVRCFDQSEKKEMVI